MILSMKLNNFGSFDSEMIYLDRSVTSLQTNVRLTSSQAANLSFEPLIIFSPIFFGIRFIYGVNFSLAQFFFY